MYSYVSIPAVIIRANNNDEPETLPLLLFIQRGAYMSEDMKKLSLKTNNITHQFARVIEVH